MGTEPIIENNKIPNFVQYVLSGLSNAGFESFIVGGCVRDLLINRTPKDWDITTNANPDQIIQIFEKTIYENNFGTVGVCIPKEEVTHETIDNVPRETLENVTRETKYNIVEVTPYRLEGKYLDFRHPEDVKFSKNIEDDLKRRDFTINAMAYGINTDKGHFIDLFDGIKDIKDKIIRAVGNPNDRFQEDALRMLRTIRFASELNYAIDYETMQGIASNSNLIKNISSERIRDEFTKIITSDNPSLGIIMLHKLGLLKFIIPELEEGIGCEQGGAHIYDVFSHCLQALDHAKDKDFDINIRLASLFHDVGKPRTRRPGVKKSYTFYGHEVVGARMVKIIMERLKFSKRDTEFVVSMVRNHMFFADTEKITLSAVRRMVAKVGKDHIWDLMNIRECDRVGMKKIEAPYRLRKYHAMIEEVLRDPISVSALTIDGNYLINDLNIKPGPRMGWILNALLEEVLDDPNKNTKEHLGELVRSLDMLGDKELKALGERGKDKKEELEEKEIEKLHKKHGV